MPQQQQIQRRLFPQSYTNPPPPPPPPPATSTFTAATANSSKSRTRLFSANDEILILKALSDYKSKTGHDPMSHFTAFYNSCNVSLSFQPTQRQFYKRVWKLKNKFAKNKGENKKDHTFSCSLENELFDLSLKFWGQDIASKKREKPSNPSKPEPVVVKESAKGESKDEKIDTCLREMFRFDEMSLKVLKRGMELVGESERLELDRRWKRLRVQECGVFIMRAELVGEQLDMIYKELQGSS